MVAERGATGARAGAGGRLGAEGAGVVLSLPVLPVKETVLFPGLTTTVTVGRKGSVSAIQAALATEDKALMVVAQRDAGVENPGPEDLYRVGTRAVIRQMAPDDSGGVRVLLVGTERVEIEAMEQLEPYRRARVRTIPKPTDAGPEVEALRRSVLELGQRALELTRPGVEVDLTRVLPGADDPLLLAGVVASMLPLETEKEQAVLEAPTRAEALRLALGYLRDEVQVLEVRQQIAGQASDEMQKTQREYILRQQLKAIQSALGEMDPQKAEVAQLRERLEAAQLPEAVRKEAERELDRLERLPPAAPDYQMTRGYLELVAELPWGASTEDVIDLKRARAILDEDHYDLDEVKDRIIEELAVMKLNPGAHAPILCFVGPPGVGKTSLGQSIARALGRRFERLSLGGVHDEAELRGHRRTYIGAMPGRIIQALRRAGVNNPLLMLDEVDKLGQGFHGDPAAALLEILDPAQNNTFRDNYLDLPFDLSKVFFITTANTTETIPRALLDRMEVLRLSGYSHEEKLFIAKKYLLPRRVREAGLREGQLVVPDEVLLRVISRYTREAGVRELERVLGRIARRVARRFAERAEGDGGVAGGAESVVVRVEDLQDLVGDERFFPEEARPELQPGVAAGLAWTPMGGEILYVEAALLPQAGGGGGLRITGSLGEVMRESAQAAQAYIWSHAGELGLDVRVLKENGVHLHVPAGAVPKDGPSAGVAMVAAMASLYAGVPVRKDTAMTGEITLTGLVLPVGGIKEKVLAAHRAGLSRVILPRENERDLRHVPEQVRGALEFILVSEIGEVLRAALVDGEKRVAAGREAVGQARGEGAPPAGGVGG